MWWSALWRGWFVLVRTVSVTTHRRVSGTPLRSCRAGRVPRCSAWKHRWCRSRLTLCVSSPGWRPAGSNARRAGMVCSAVGVCACPAGRTGWVIGFGRGGAVRVCAVTHVLLPVTVLRRRAYAVERIWAALSLRADGPGGGGKAPGDEFWMVPPGGHGPQLHGASFDQETPATWPRTALTAL
jgi:hypothetical protein